MPNISEERIFKIIGTFYDIAQQPSSEPWVEVYQEMARLFGSGAGGISVFDKRNGRYSVFEGTTEQEMIDKYFDHYQHISPLRPVIAALNEGERYNRQLHISDEEFRELPIYNEFYKKIGVFHFEYRVFLDQADTKAGVSFSRPDGHPNFTESEINAMAYLMPHLAKSFKMHLDLLEVHRENRAISEAFDHIPQGVIVIDSYRKLVFANARGTELINAGDGLKTDGKGVVRTTKANGHLERLISGMFEGQAAEADKHGVVSTVERGDGRRPLELVISPFLDENFRGIGAEPLAVIYVTDPDARSVDVAGMLTEIYGLTPTEARLADLLAAGRSFAEACTEMSIAGNTGRTHLKRIFSKTGTNGQSALVRLILNGPANLSS